MPDPQAAPSAPRVFAVVVTYEPDVAQVAQLLARLAPQVAQIVVVDNGSAMDRLRELILAQPASSADCFWIGLPENRGVGAAQNLGIRYALNQGADAVLLMDHDSLPATQMVAELVRVWSTLQQQGIAVGSVGPRYLDQRQQNPPPFVRSAGGRLRRMQRTGGEAQVEVDYLIASGSLLPRAALEQAGLMDEGLFIDYVDIEWGWRAAAAGFRHFGAWEAQMGHDLGEEPVRFLGRYYPRRAPQRYAYMYRNAVWMLRQAHVPRRWKVVEGYRLVLRALFYLLIAPERRSSWQAIRKGLVAGWRGERGALAPEPVATTDPDSQRQRPTISE